MRFASCTNGPGSLRNANFVAGPHGDCAVGGRITVSRGTGAGG